MTIDEPLFADFQRDRNVYLQAIQFWRNLWDTVQPESMVEWQTPWFAVAPADLQDGNPIFTAVSRSTRRGLRVIQLDLNEEQPPLQFWTSWFGGRTNPDAVEELVIACKLTGAIVPLLKAIIQGWVQDGRVRLVHSRTAVQSYQHESSVAVNTAPIPVAA
jgi:hypothetical protein